MWVMSFCHFGQDIPQAAKNMCIPKYQKYVRRLQNVLTRDKTEFSLHKSLRNSKKAASSKDKLHWWNIFLIHLIQGNWFFFFLLHEQVIFNVNNKVS